MEVEVTPEQEEQLTKVAALEGLRLEELVKDAALRLLEDGRRFRAGVQPGIEETGRGDLSEKPKNGHAVETQVRGVMRIRWTFSAAVDLKHLKPYLTQQFPQLAESKVQDDL